MVNTAGHGKDAETGPCQRRALVTHPRGGGGAPGENWLHVFERASVRGHFYIFQI